MPPLRSRRLALLAAITAAAAGSAVLLLPRAAPAEIPAPGDAGGAEATASGPRIAFAAPPSGVAGEDVAPASDARTPARWARTCSLRLPVCAHAPVDLDPGRALAALAAVERGWEAVFGALALPAPDPCEDGAWQVFLVDGVPGGGDALARARDPVARFDRGLSFGRIDRSLSPGCALDLAATRSLARAAILRAAPATDEGTASAAADALARLAVPCAGDDGDRAVFQAWPERTLVDPTSPDFDRGASLFFDWLDGAFAREPGALVRGLLALSPTRTPPGAERWAARPSAYDVIRVSLHGAFGPDSNLDDVFARFAVARAKARPSPELAWHVGWPSAARRLASPEPVSPTGASYVLVDHDGAPPGARLRLEAEWEDYGRMRWLAVKLDARGQAAAVVAINSLDRGTRASMTLEALEAVAGILVVG
ncbi:MAG: hypothetical protein JOZ69_16570, partial [Myxococcales bacterium]|nr:hypothetical protein [Myxococcales bacterium]